MILSKQEMGRLQRIGTATADRKAYIDYGVGPAYSRIDSVFGTVIGNDIVFHLPEVRRNVQT